MRINEAFPFATYTSADLKSIWGVCTIGLCVALYKKIRIEMSARQAKEAIVTRKKADEEVVDCALKLFDTFKNLQITRRLIRQFRYSHQPLAYVSVCIFDLNEIFKLVMVLNHFIKLLILLEDFGIELDYVIHFLLVYF